MTQRQQIKCDLSAKRLSIKDEEQTSTWSIQQVRKPGKAYGRSWAIIFLDAARAMSRTRYTGATAQVLFWAIAELHPRDWTIARHSEIAAQLGLTRSAVTRALIDLRKRGVVQKGEHNMLRLSLWFGWQGTVQAYQKSKRGRYREAPAAQQWHKEHDIGEERKENNTALVRIADDGEATTGKRETRQRRGDGEARAFGTVIAGYILDEGDDDAA